MPIHLAKYMQIMTIRQITGSDSVKLHLMNLGIVVGEQIILISKNSDNIIIKIKGISLAISKELSKRILV